mmetsp:Transcript_44183/g.95859  ORF Transcript_44183/g.95859 Transcript_44183/m.95859 type:complete len:80 (+) Transcript_44183:25-264(+)
MALCMMVHGTVHDGVSQCVCVSGEGSGTDRGGEERGRQGEGEDTEQQGHEEQGDAGALDEVRGGGLRPLSSRLEEASCR